MAKQHTARRGSGAAATKNQPGNQTPNTPDINESEIARLKVDQLRDRLRRRGVTGTADMRKPDLVDALIQALREGRKTTRSRAGSGSGRDRASSASGPGRRGPGGRPGTAPRGRGTGGEQPGNQTPNTPEVNESEIARLTVDQLRDRLRRRGVTGTADMRKPDLVDALIQALREGRKTTRSRGNSGSHSSSSSGSRGSSGSTARRSGGEQPGNQTPNTPEVNESEIARLTVDQLRDRLRRRGVTGTADMRKPDLVDALIQALREGRKTTRSRGASGSHGNSSSRGGSGSHGNSGSRASSGSRGGSGSATRRSATTVGAAPDATELADVERRAAELADVAPQAPEVEEVERRAAELEGAGTEATPLPALPASPADRTPAARDEGARVPRRRSGAHDTVPDDGDRQPVRVTGDARSGASTVAAADRVVASMVPPEVDRVDEVVTPEGTMITTAAGQAVESVDSPPLPGTRKPRP
ncbi:hypothetical protein [Micromonospora chersina]|uniref:hypothetical protein n=1 Tax=Micromonospora chersina TaxID=47854 RepID=UPI0033B52E9B